MASLLIITSSYPYGLGEAFFASELNALSRRFNRIDILPSTAPTKEVRAVPINVRVLRPLLASKMQDVLNAFKAPVESLQAATALLPSLVPLMDIANSVRIRAALSHRMEELKKAEYDLTYVYWGFPWSVMIPQLRSIAPCIQRFHAWDLWGGSGGTSLRAGVANHVNGLERLYFVSRAGLNLMSQALPEGLKDRLHVRYLGSTDFGELAPAPYSEGLSIISCSFISEKKRLDRLARIVRLLCNKTRVRWTHIGGGDSAAIEDLSKLAGQHANVQFLGSIPHSRIPNVFHAVRPNILMSLSSSEGLAINVLEAMSAGVPIVSTNVGGMSEAVSDEVGILIEKGNFDNYELLAEKIFRESQNGGLLASAKPRSVWKTKFDATSNATIFADEIRTLCDARRDTA